jgi:hypothetical protein
MKKQHTICCFKSEKIGGKISVKTFAPPTLPPCFYGNYFATDLKNFQPSLYARKAPAIANATGNAVAT